MRAFDAYGQALLHNTRFQDAKYYDADFSRESFTNLYPFLPAHFDILLHLLGALAKSTGWHRPEIRNYRNPGHPGRGCHVDRRRGSAVGWLATTVTLYDELEKDIRRAFLLSLHQAVGKVMIRFPDSQVHQRTRQNGCRSSDPWQLAGLRTERCKLDAVVGRPSLRGLDEVRKAVEEMLNDPLAPLGDKDGSLCFLSEKLRDIVGAGEPGRLRAGEDPTAGRIPPADRTERYLPTGRTNPEAEDLA